VGGNVGRQVQFAIATGAVFVRKLDRTTDRRVARRERVLEPQLPQGSRSVEIFDEAVPSAGPGSSRR